MTLKFIPVRGRKLNPLSFYCACKIVEIYPREGTETTCGRWSRRFVLVEIYPREGTETKFIVAVHCIEVVEIYPREGTETIV